MSLGARLADLLTLAERVKVSWPSASSATVKDVYENFLCPRVDRHQCSILEWLRNDNFHSDEARTPSSVDTRESKEGPKSVQSRSFQKGPHVTIVYPYQMPFLDLVAILSARLSTKEADERATSSHPLDRASSTQFWVDFLCIRPRCLMANKTDDEYHVFWADAVDAQMMRTTKTCLIMSPWESNAILRHSQTLTMLYATYFRQQMLRGPAADASAASKSPAMAIEFDVWLSPFDYQRMMKVAAEDVDVVCQLWKAPANWTQCYTEHPTWGARQLVERLFDKPLPANTVTDGAPVKLEWKSLATSVEQLLSTWLRRCVDSEQSLQTKLKPLFMEFARYKRAFHQAYDHPGFSNIYFIGGSLKRDDVRAMVDAFHRCRALMGQVHALLQFLRRDASSACTTNDSAAELVRMLREVTQQALVLHDDDPGHLDPPATATATAGSSGATDRAFVSMAASSTAPQHDALDDLFQQWCAWSIRCHGPEHRESLAARAFYGHYQRSVVGDYATAELLLTQCISVQRRLFPEQDEDLMTSLFLLAQLQYDLGRYTQADVLLHECLAGRVYLYGPSGATAAAMHQRAAGSYSFDDDRPAHHPHGGGGGGGAEDLRVLEVVLLLGQLSNIQRRFSHAEAYFKRYLAGLSASLGRQRRSSPPNRSTAASPPVPETSSGEARASSLLTSLGVTSGAASLSSAAPSLSRSTSELPLALSPALLEGVPTYLLAAQHLANLYVVQWQYDKAEPLLRQLFELRELHAQRCEQLTAAEFFAPAAAGAATGGGGGDGDRDASLRRGESARSTCDRAALRRLSFTTRRATDHVVAQYLEALVELAQCYRRMERFEVAEGLLHAAMRQAQRYHDADHPSVRLYRHLYDECVAEAVEWQEGLGERVKQQMQRLGELVGPASPAAGRPAGAATTAAATAAAAGDTRDVQESSALQLLSASFSSSAPSSRAHSSDAEASPPPLTLHRAFVGAAALPNRVAPAPVGAAGRRPVAKDVEGPQRRRAAEPTAARPRGGDSRACVIS